MREIENLINRMVHICSRCNHVYLPQEYSELRNAIDHICIDCGNNTYDVLSEYIYRKVLAANINQEIKNEASVDKVLNQKTEIVKSHLLDGINVVSLNKLTTMKLLEESLNREILKQPVKVTDIQVTGDHSYEVYIENT